MASKGKSQYLVWPLFELFLGDCLEVFFSILLAYYAIVKKIWIAITTLLKQEIEWWPKTFAQYCMWDRKEKKKTFTPCCISDVYVNVCDSSFCCLQQFGFPGTALCKNHDFCHQGDKQQFRAPARCNSGLPDPWLLLLCASCFEGGIPVDQWRWAGLFSKPVLLKVCHCACYSGWV